MVFPVHLQNTTTSLFLVLETALNLTLQVVSEG